MKQQANTLGTSKVWVQMHEASDAAVSFVAGIVSAVYQGLSAVVTKMQISRMESVLHRMSDAELAQAGITRAEIKGHARFLVNYTYDGL
ncbi:MAG: hypothetical protein P8P40_10070 [Sulfitobacter sp.]|jgi:ethanolamine utilization protein EutP (predicted NTPase)|nr:hypothetical protein [Sulfitobacter sp.]